MSTLRDDLREADPLAHEPMLSDDETAALRQRVLSFAPHTTRRRLPGRRLTLITAVALLVVVANGLVRVAMQRRPPTQSRMSGSVDETPAAGESVRRVYFQTPSGMRVVWVFEPESGKETLP
jgi:hypothetical protein